MIKAIITDIEGTTSSIAFVHEVLFPYAAKHLSGFVLDNQNTPDVRVQLDEVSRLAAIRPDDIDSIIKQLQAWIAEDKKVTPLKALQGMIWRTGYENGDYVGHIYADAYESLQRWSEQGIPLYVYSSGSVGAQRLLFGHTLHGDLNPLFAGNFDTLVGGKKEAASYLKIVCEIGEDPADVLFLSDIVEELDAAKIAGLKTCWLVRDELLPAQAEHTAVNDFNAIDPAFFSLP